MNARKLSLVLIAILLFALIATACAAGNKEAATDSMMPDVSYDSPAEAPEYGYDSGYNDVSKYPTSDSSGGAVVGDAATMSEKIIRTVSMDAQTKEYDKAVGEIRSAVVRLGGFEESFRSTGRNYYSSNLYSRSAYMVLRIPAEQLDAFLGEVGSLVNVLSQNIGASNVTSEYYDIQTRIGVLESERDAYEEMLKQSMDVEYLLKVKDRLYNVIEEIEAYKTRLNVLDSKVSYSTVSISLSEVVEYTPVVYEEPTFGERVKEAFVTSWKNFADGCQNFAIWFVEAFPTLLVVAAIVTVVLVIVVRIRRKRNRPAAQATTEQTSEPQK